ncbi:MAG: peptidoglycan D,D-transpeptidase FtsI family protein [Janthinobacterium lividum]
MRLPAWRSRVVLVIAFLAFAGLLARAAWVQLIDAPFYAEQGRKRFERVIAIPAARGEIFDRNGRLLAISQPLRAIYAMPMAFAAPVPADKLAALALLLDMPVADVAARLRAERAFVYLKRQVPLAVAARIDALGIAAVRSFDEWKRFYPDGEASAQVVGFTDIDERGQEGIEASQDARLRPRPGRRVVIRSRLGDIVEDGLIEAPRPGAPVHLTIDARLQHLAFTALRAAIAQHDAQAGGAVVVDAVNGEILALVNWPSFDPNAPRGRQPGGVRNRVVTDTFEPGSTIKPIHVAAALEAGRVTPQTVFDVSPGWLRLGKFTVRDVSPQQALSVEDIVQRSSNVGMVRMTQHESREAMWHVLRQAGFGAAPDIGFPGTAAGRLRDVQAWSNIDQAALSYGYGASVSLLQLARAYTMFGAAGQLLPLSLVSGAPGTRAAAGAALPAPLADVGGTGDATDAADATNAPAPGISPRTALQVRHMLERATGPQGTARRGKVEQYRVGVKTGTTRKVDGGAYATRRYLATAVGIAPVAAPRFVVAVMIDDPKGAARGGGAVAAPVFSRIMGEALRLHGVAPDHLPPDFGGI